MGCNFYLKDKTHIGKRSAAGMYCFDCNVSLCYQGENKVHYAESHFYEKCPKCKTKPSPETLGNSSAGLELGFNKNTTEKKKGVRSCSSFSWAMKREDLEKSRKLKVYDEYKNVMTKKEFIEMVENIPIQFTDKIGVEFS